jgi:WD40 repeat protein
MILRQLSFASSRASWQFGNALLQSFAVVFSLVLLAGIVFLPEEIRKLTVAPDISVSSFSPNSAGRSAVALERIIPRQSRDGLQHRIVVHDLTQRKRREMNLSLPGRPVSITTTPDDKLAFIANEEGGIYGVNLQKPSLQPSLIGRHVRGIPRELACSRDGTTLVSLDGDAIYAWDVEQWRIRWCRINMSATCATILPDSKTLICQQSWRSQGRMVELDLLTGDFVRVISDGELNLHNLVASADGCRLVGSAFCGTILLWQRESLNAPWQRQEIPGLRCGISCVASTFAPHSDWLVCGHIDGRRLVVWDVERGLPLCEVGSSEEEARGGRFLDENTLLSWNDDGSFRLWDLRNPSQARSVPMTQGAG